jgi:hypothetical protein
MHKITPDRSMSAADAFNRRDVSLNASDGRDTAKKAPAEAALVTPRLKLLISKGLRSHQNCVLHGCEATS